MCHAMRLIHISDLHLTDLSAVEPREIRGKRRLGHASWRRRRRHRHLPAHLDALRQAVRDAQPDFIVITGDLIHLGLPNELAAAADWLEALAPPHRTMVTPGNHDLYATDSWRACERHWGAYLHLSPTVGEIREAPFRNRFPSQVRLGGIELYGLNTGCPTPWGAASGHLGAGQRQRLRRLMGQAPAGTLKVVALHHAPVPGVMSRRRALTDARALKAVLADAHLVLHGHGHWSRSYRCGRARVFATGSASTADAAFRQFDIQGSASDVQVHMSLHVRSADGGGFALGEEAAFSVSTAG